MFVIEDEMHAEPVGNFGRRSEALAELRRLAQLKWDEAPNLCPCTSWRTCGRRYHIIEYDISSEPWSRTGDEAMLEVSARGTTWLGAVGDGGEAV